MVLIGLGNIGQGYDYNESSQNCILTHAQALSSDSRFELIGAVDPVREKRDVFKKKFKKLAWASINDIDASTNPDVFVVATPANSRIDVFNQIFSRFRPQAILCEKPLALSSDEANCVLEKCRTNDSKLFLNFIRRADPAVQKIKTLLERRVITGKFCGVCWYSFGLYNSASHFCDLFNFFFGDPKAWGRRSLLSLSKNTEDFDLNFFVEYQNGDIEFKVLPSSKVFHNQFDIFFENYLISCNKNGNFSCSEVVRDKYSNERFVFSEQSLLIPSEMKFYQKNIYEHLNLALSQQQHSLSSGDDGLKLTGMFEELKQ